MRTSCKGGPQLYICEGAKEDKSGPLSLPVKSRFPETETAVRRDRFDISGYWAKVPSPRSLFKAESPIGKRSRLRSNEI